VTPSTAAALTGAKDVVVFANNLVPPVAEKLTIIQPAAAIVVTGHLVNVINGTVTLKVHHPGTKKTAANSTNETFQLTPTTKFEFHKGNVVEPANAGALGMKGEHKVTITAKAGTPPTADLVQIHVPSKPHTVKGHILQVGQNAITLKVHHPAKDGQPAQDTMETVQLSPTATFELHQGKTKQPIAAAALQVGLEVHAHGHAATPFVADRVDIFVPVAKAVNLTGTIVAFGNNAIQVKSKDGNVHTFQLTPNTKIETVVKGVAQPVNPANLQPGVTVVIHGISGTPNGTVDRIDVKNKK
jgi:hypothetical protein